VASKTGRISARVGMLLLFLLGQPFIGVPLVLAAAYALGYPVAAVMTARAPVVGAEVGVRSAEPGISPPGVA